MAGRVGIPLRVALGPVSLLGRPSHQGQPRMFWKRGSLCPDQGWDMVLLWKMRMGFSASPPHPLPIPSRAKALHPLAPLHSWWGLLPPAVLPSWEDVQSSSLVLLEQILQ